MSDAGSGEPEAGHDEVVDATRAKEEEEDGAAGADRAPTAKEGAAAEQNTLDLDRAEHEREMGRLAAEVKGDGQID